nr:MAG TPA: hypothetical protein [Caudoviricetes sp.]
MDAKPENTGLLKKIEKALNPLRLKAFAGAATQI